MTEKQLIAKMAGGWWAVFGFRFRYGHRYRLSKCLCFGSVYNYYCDYSYSRRLSIYLGSSYRNFSSLGIQPYNNRNSDTYLLYLRYVIIRNDNGCVFRRKLEALEPFRLFDTDMSILR